MPFFVAIFHLLTITSPLNHLAESKPPKPAVNKSFFLQRTVYLTAQRDLLEIVRVAVMLCRLAKDLSDFNTFPCAPRFSASVPAAPISVLFPI